MQVKKKRLTLDVDPAFQRRLKATAALRGVSMRQYCLGAIEGELDKDEDDREAERPFAERSREASEEWAIQHETAITDKKRSGHLDIEGLKSLRDELFGDRVFPGNSADLLREARAIRDAEIEGWA